MRASELTGRVECAARTLWLNRACFKGLYRLNQAGGFNSPIGGYDFDTVKMVDAKNIHTVSAALHAHQAVLMAADFGAVLDHVELGATVYADPPYMPVNKGSFNTYDGVAFGLDAQERLADALVVLSSRGARVLASNADTPASRQLYESRGLQVHEVQVRRNLNCDGEKRGAVGELLVLSGGHAASPSTP